MIEVTESECLPNFELKFKFLENLKKKYSHSKVRENALTLTLKGFPLYAHWRGSQK